MTTPTRPAARAGQAPAGGGDHHLLTTAETAALLRTTPGYLRRMRYLGTGPKYLAGGKVKYRRVDVDAWLERQLVTPGP